MDISIFGTDVPKVEYNSVEYELNYASITAYKDEHDKKDVLHESIINRHREWSNQGEHYTFKVIINLFKHGDNAVIEYNKLLALKNQLVKLWLRKDSNNFKKAKDNSDALFYVLKLTAYYHPDIPGLPDLLYLELVSQDPIIITSVLKT